jgi:hypothetical protein
MCRWAFGEGLRVALGDVGRAFVFACDVIVSLLINAVCTLPRTIAPTSPLSPARVSLDSAPVQRDLVRQREDHLGDG